MELSMNLIVKPAIDKWDRPQFYVDPMVVGQVNNQLVEVIITVFKCNIIKMFRTHMSKHSSH